MGQVDVKVIVIGNEFLASNGPVAHREERQELFLDVFFCKPACVIVLQDVVVEMLH